MHYKLKFRKIEQLIAVFFILSMTIPLAKAFFGKWSMVYFWDGGLVLLYCSWGIRLCFSEWNLNFSILDFLLSGLLFIFLISSIFGQRADVSFQAWFLWYRSFLVYFYFSRNIGTVLSIRMFFYCILLVVLSESAIAIFQFITASNVGQVTKYFGEYNPRRVPYFYIGGIKLLRAPGTFFNTGLLASWMLLLEPIIFSVFLLKGKKNSKFLILIVWIVGIIAAMTTLSRIQFALILFSSFIILFQHNFIQIIINRPVLIVLLIITGLFAIGGLGYFIVINGYQHSLISLLTNFQGRFEKKIAYMMAALQIIAQHPIRGVGLSNFGLFLDNTAFDFYHHSEGVVHNIPLLIGAESGCFGLFFIIMIGLYLSIRWLDMILKRPKDLSSSIRSGAMTGIFCTLINMQLTANFVHHSLMPLFFLILGVCFNKKEAHATFN